MRRFLALCVLVLALIAAAALVMVPIVAAAVGQAQDSTAQAPAVPAQLAALWLALVGAATTALTDLLKRIAAPISKLPDPAKAVVAFVLALVTSKLAGIFHVPIPPDLAGFSGIVVNWLLAMGLQGLGKAVGVIKPVAAAA